MPKTKSPISRRMARKLLLMFLAPAIFVLASPSAQAQPTSEPITIWSDGVQLAGDLWKPQGLEADEKRPALLMVHGWGGTKSHLNQAYAPHFAALGYLVLTFDYRGWGDSDGKLLRTGAKPQGDTREYVLRVQEVRTIVDPIDQLEDIRNAYYYLIGEANVDPNRLAIWGSSLGGGLALQTAATLPGFQVLITQVGAVNPQAGLKDPESPFNEQAMISWRSARARGEAAPFPGPETTTEGLTGFPDWPEYVTYDPFASRNKLTAATLIIDAADEELFDIQRNGHALFEDIKDRLSARYEALPGKHYDIYRGESYQKAVELESSWLREHLPL